MKADAVGATSRDHDFPTTRSEWAGAFHSGEARRLCTLDVNSTFDVSLPCCILAFLESDFRRFLGTLRDSTVDRNTGRFGKSFASLAHLSSQVPYCLERNRPLDARQYRDKRRWKKQTVVCVELRVSQMVNTQARERRWRFLRTLNASTRSWTGRSRNQVCDAQSNFPSWLLCGGWEGSPRWSWAAYMQMTFQTWPLLSTSESAKIVLRWPRFPFAELRSFWLALNLDPPLRAMFYLELSVDNVWTPKYWTILLSLWKGQVCLLTPRSQEFEDKSGSTTKRIANRVCLAGFVMKLKCDPLAVVARSWSLPQTLQVGTRSGSSILIDRRELASSSGLFPASGTMHCERKSFEFWSSVPARQQSGKDVAVTSRWWEEGGDMWTAKALRCQHARAGWWRKILLVDWRAC